MYDIERYLNIRSAYGPSFSPGGTLSFLINTTGTSQVWTLEEPGAWPEQRTFYDEPISFASWSPEREELAFGMDVGGNELTQLHLLDGETGRVRRLTDQPDAKHLWGGWSHDGSRFAFTSNRRDESVFDVYVQRRDSDEAERVYEGDGWFTVAAWHPDGDRLVLSRAASNFDQDLYLLDLDTRETTHLTPHDGPVRYLSVNWDPAGEALYLVTDRDSDSTYLARLDPDTREMETVADGDGWNVEGVGIDVDTGRILYSVNADGFSELTVGTLRDGVIDTHPDPDLPRGILGGASFDDGAERLAVAVTSSTVNANVYVVDLETGDHTASGGAEGRGGSTTPAERCEAEQWTFASTAGIPRSSFVEPELVHFSSFDGLEVPALLSLPRDADNPPVVIDIHGGPESQRRPGFSSVKQFLLNHGYGVMEPNVRGSTGYGKAYSRLDDKRKRMDSVRDVEAAVRYLRDRGDVDPDRVAAMGGSYGGFMVLAALTEYPDLFAAGIDIVGIANFVTFLENTGAWRRKLREQEYGSLDEDRDFLEKISPINNVEKIRAPLLVLHGANDPRVPVGEAEQIAEEVEARGVPVQKIIFEDEGHGFAKLENRVTAYRAVVDFLDRHLKQG